jgi:hypothetical protein
MAPIRRAIVAFLAAGTGSAVRLDDDVFQDPAAQQQQQGAPAQTADATSAQQGVATTGTTTTQPLEPTNSGDTQKRMGEAAAKASAEACNPTTTTPPAVYGSQEEELLAKLAVTPTEDNATETTEAPLPQSQQDQQVAQVDTAKVNALVDSGENLFNADGSLKEGVLREDSAPAGQQAAATTATTTAAPDGNGTAAGSGEEVAGGDEMMLLTQGKTTKDLDNENKKLRKELADFTIADSPCREVRKQSYLSFDSNDVGDLLGEAAGSGSGTPALAGADAAAQPADAQAAAAPAVAASVHEAFPELDASKEKIEAELMKAAGVVSQPGSASLLSEDPLAPAAEDSWALHTDKTSFGTPTFVPGDGFVAEYEPPQNTEGFRGGPCQEQTNWHENTEVVAQVEGAVHKALGNDYAKHYADYHHEDQFQLLPNVGKDIDGHIASLDANPHYH